MTTDGTPDPTSDPSDPVGGTAASGQPSPDQPDATGTGFPPGPQQPGYQQPGYQAGYQQPGYARPPYPPAPPLSPSDERMWATFAHIGPVVLSFVAPLVIWLVFRERSRFVDDQGKEALNFQIFLAVLYVVGGITTVILIGFFVLLAAWVMAIVFGILGAMAASRGELYRYPVSWRVIK